MKLTNDALCLVEEAHLEKCKKKKKKIRFSKEELFCNNLHYLEKVKNL